MPKASISKYPRTGKLAMGDGDAFGPGLDKIIKSNARLRKSGISDNFASRLSGLLDDAFHGGVVATDKGTGRTTEMPKGKDVALMHQCRAVHINSVSRDMSRSRDDAQVAEMMFEAGRRAWVDGVMYAQSGKLRLLPLFNFEPTELWRHVPSRYSYELQKICEYYIACATFGVEAAEMQNDESGSFRAVLRKPGTEHMPVQGSFLFYYVVTPACIRALEKAGMIDLQALSSNRLSPSATALRAFEEHRAWWPVEGWPPQAVT